MQDIESSIGEGLEGSDPDNSAKYIDWLQSTATESSQQARRLFIWILVLMAAFGLVAESSGTTLSIGNFHIYKGSVVLQFIPALVSLCFLQVVYDTRKLILYRSALRAAVRQWNRAAVDNGLDTLIRPPSLLYWNVTPNVSPALTHPKEYKFITAVGGALFIVLILGELAFQILSYIKLFSLPKANYVSLIASAVIAFAGTVLAFGYLFMLNIEGFRRRLPWRRPNPRPAA
jgi:hypothetical protein